MSKRIYTRFYALLKEHPRVDKDELVLQFTDGRTTHLTEMTDEEYADMVRCLEQASAPASAELKRWRSSVLLRIGRLGISTIDNWDGINSFVSSPRIAGKLFYDLTVDDLRRLVRKLEAIERNGGLKRKEETPAPSSEQPANIDLVMKMYRPSGVIS